MVLLDKICVASVPTNVTLDDVNFGGGIGANNLTGQTRLQQFFYAGF